MVDKSIEVYKQWQEYISTSKLNKWIEYVQKEHQPIMVKGNTVKLKYITQAKKRPPTFTVFTNHTKAIKGSYEKYLINSLRRDFNLTLTPIRLIIRKSDNPFKDVKYKKSL